MKKTIFFSILLLSVLTNINALSQKKLNFILKYDSEFKRYEVCANPNFSEKNFIWGPSQVSLVIPSSVLVEKIRITNVDGGTWDDTSIILSPEVTPEKSFHGISSSGERTDLVENHEAVLFYFTLPNNINPSEVRLYDNKLDPKSSDKGMMGGDFSNTVVDVTGVERYNNGNTPPKQISTEVQSNPLFDVVVYPNIITENKFQLKIDGINESDGDILMILSDDLGRQLKRMKASKAEIEKQLFTLTPHETNKGLVIKFISSKGAISKRLLSEN